MVDAKKIGVAGAAIVLVTLVAVFATSYMSDFETARNPPPNTDDEFQTVELKESPVLGSKSAPVTIVEVGDYQCHMCKLWFEETRPLIIENYVNTGKASLVFIDLPILGPDSKLAAEATYCADDQDRYWEYHVTLYDYQGHMNSGWASIDRLHSFAFNLGLDMDEFEECITSYKYEQRVLFNKNKAGAVANSTPTFIIVNAAGDQKQIRGAQPYSVFEQTIESLL